MLTIVRAGMITLSLLVGACGPSSLFPSNVVKDVDTSFDFNTWRASPTSNQERKVQIGGRIIQAETTNEGLLIVGEQLPIVEHPVYGPATPKKRFGVYEFALLYPGKMEPTSLITGNRFIVIGTTRRPRMVVVEGASKTEPYLIAQCIHVWKTGEKDIADFPEVGAGYYPLESDTYCVSRQ
jgi:starvation-inducible outer membrane lipoprotein